MSLRKLVEALVEPLTERKAFPMGTIRRWGGREYQKQADGSWLPRTKKAIAHSYHSIPTPPAQ